MTGRHARPLLFTRSRAGFAYKRSTGALSGLAATLDHLYSKLHPLRYKPVDHHKYVMACSTCNNNRSKVENQIVGLGGKLEERIYPPEERLTRGQWDKLLRKHKAAQSI